MKFFNWMFQISNTVYSTVYLNTHIQCSEMNQSNMKIQFCSTGEKSSLTSGLLGVEKVLSCIP